MERMPRQGCKGPSSFTVTTRRDDKERSTAEPVAAYPGAQKLNIHGHNK